MPLWFNHSSFSTNATRLQQSNSKSTVVSNSDNETPVGVSSSEGSVAVSNSQGIQQQKNKRLKPSRRTSNGRFVSTSRHSISQVTEQMSDIRTSNSKCLRSIKTQNSLLELVEDKTAETTNVQHETVYQDDRSPNDNGASLERRKSIRITASKKQVIESANAKIETVVTKRSRSKKLQDICDEGGEVYDGKCQGREILNKNATGEVNTGGKNDTISDTNNAKEEERLQNEQEKSLSVCLIRRVDETLRKEQSSGKENEKSIKILDVCADFTDDDYNAMDDSESELGDQTPPLVTGAPTSHTNAEQLFNLLLASSSVADDGNSDLILEGCKDEVRNNEACSAPQSKRKIKFFSPKCKSIILRRRWKNYRFLNRKSVTLRKRLHKNSKNLMKNTDTKCVDSELGSSLHSGTKITFDSLSTFAVVASSSERDSKVDLKMKKEIGDPKFEHVCKRKVDVSDDKNCKSVVVKKRWQNDRILHRSNTKQVVKDPCNRIVGDKSGNSLRRLKEKKQVLFKNVALLMSQDASWNPKTDSNLRLHSPNVQSVSVRHGRKKKTTIFKKSLIFRERWKQHYLQRRYFNKYVSVLNSMRMKRSNFKANGHSGFQVKELVNDSKSNLSNTFSDNVCKTLIDVDDANKNCDDNNAEKAVCVNLQPTVSTNSKTIDFMNCEADGSLSNPDYTDIHESHVSHDVTVLPQQNSAENVDKTKNCDLLKMVIDFCGIDDGSLGVGNTSDTVERSFDYSDASGLTPECISPIPVNEDQSISRDLDSSGSVTKNYHRPRSGSTVLNATPIRRSARLAKRLSKESKESNVSTYSFKGVSQDQSASSNHVNCTSCTTVASMHLADPKHCSKSDKSEVKGICRLQNSKVLDESKLSSSKVVVEKLVVFDTITSITLSAEGTKMNRLELDVSIASVSESNVASDARDENAPKDIQTIDDNNFSTISIKVNENKFSGNGGEQIDASVTEINSDDVGHGNENTMLMVTNGTVNGSLDNEAILETHVKHTNEHQVVDENSDFQPVTPSKRMITRSQSFGVKTPLHSTYKCIHCAGKCHEYQKTGTTSSSNSCAKLIPTPAKRSPQIIDERSSMIDGLNLPLTSTSSTDATEESNNNNKMAIKKYLSKTTASVTAPTANKSSRRRKRCIWDQKSRKRKKKTTDDGDNDAIVDMSHMGSRNKATTDATVVQDKKIESNVGDLQIDESNTSETGSVELSVHSSQVAEVLKSSVKSPEGILLQSLIQLALNDRSCAGTKSIYNTGPVYSFDQNEHGAESFVHLAKNSRRDKVSSSKASKNISEGMSTPCITFKDAEHSGNVDGLRIDGMADVNDKSKEIKNMQGESKMNHFIQGKLLIKKTISSIVTRKGSRKLKKVAQIRWYRQWVAKRIQRNIKVQRNLNRAKNYYRSKSKSDDYKKIVATLPKVVSTLNSKANVETCKKSSEENFAKKCLPEFSASTNNSESSWKSSVIIRHSPKKSMLADNEQFVDDIDAHKFPARSSIFRNDPAMETFEINAVKQKIKVITKQLRGNSLEEVAKYDRAVPSIGPPVQRNKISTMKKVVNILVPQSSFPSLLQQQCENTSMSNDNKRVTNLSSLQPVSKSVASRSSRSSEMRNSDMTNSKSSLSHDALINLKAKLRRLGINIKDLTKSINPQHFRSPQNVHGRLQLGVVLAKDENKLNVPVQFLALKKV